MDTHSRGMLCIEEGYSSSKFSMCLSSLVIVFFLALFLEMLEPSRLHPQPSVLHCLCFMPRWCHSIQNLRISYILQPDLSPVLEMHHMISHNQNIVQGSSSQLKPSPLAPIVWAPNLGIILGFLHSFAVLIQSISKYFWLYPSKISPVQLLFSIFIAKALV